MRKPKFLGVFSRAAQATLQKSRKQFFFVWQLDKTAYAVQLLNADMAPQAPPELVSAERLQNRFRLEPGILAAPITTPDFRQLAYREAKKTQEVAELNDKTLEELEQARKTKQIETDMRDNFSKAMRALNRPRDRKGALIALEQMASAKNGIVPVHKHMFRDFGVSLRKKSLPELALKYARRVVEMSPNDDHAHFNMARILTLLGMYDQAEQHLTKARSIDSREPVYAKLQKYINGLRNS